MTVRCKFQCVAETKRRSGTGFCYDYEFQAVYDGSPENKAFFAATPSGNLKVGTAREQTFEPGKTYYIDIVPAED